MVVNSERHGELGRSSFECRSETFRVAEAFRQSPADHPGVAYRYLVNFSRSAIDCDDSSFARAL